VGNGTHTFCSDRREAARGGYGQNFPVLYAPSNKHGFRFRGAYNVRGVVSSNGSTRRRIAKEGVDDVDISTEFLASGDDRGELPVGCAERED
jgi:hypothetical protein